MSRVYSEEELSTIDKAMEEVTPIEYQLRRGACLMPKKGFTGVADGRLEPVVSIALAGKDPSK